MLASYQLTPGNAVQFMGKTKKKKKYSATVVNSSQKSLHHL
jgi:hypothetical protein